MATLTLTVNDAHVPRIQAAMGILLGTLDGNGDPRDATAEEIRQYLIDHLKDRVVKIERANTQPPDMDVT